MDDMNYLCRDCVFETYFEVIWMGPFRTMSTQCGGLTPGGHSIGGLCLSLGQQVPLSSLSCLSKPDGHFPLRKQ